MRQQKPSLDGFVPRRPGSQLGGHHAGSPAPSDPRRGVQRPSLEQPAAQPARQQPTTLRPSGAASIRSQIDESLRSIDTGEEVPGGKKGRRKDKKPQTKTRRIVKRVLIVLAVIL